MSETTAISKSKQRISVNAGGVAVQRRALIICLLFVMWMCAGSCVHKELRKEYYDDGKIKAICPYNNAGVIDGVVTTYYPSGKIQSRETYINNVKEGISKAYYESGKLKATVNFKDGKLGGKFKKYNERGIIIEEGNLQDGKREGIQKVYYESGKVAREGNFKEDKIVSETCYDENGSQIQCSNE